MGGVPRSNDLGSRLDRIERAIRDLQRNSTLNSASISEGTLTIRRGGRIRVIDNGSIIGEGTGVIDWAGDASFGGDTFIGGSTTISGDTAITGDTEVSGDLDVSGDMEVNGRIDVSGPAELTGNTHIGGNLTIDGNTTLGGTLTYGPGNRPDQVAADSTNATNAGHQRCHHRIADDSSTFGV